MKILITGFTPFGGEKINPSYEAVKLLDDVIAGAKIIKLEIPTVFRKSIEALDKAIKSEKPDIVMCIGQAGGRFEISIERIAINIDDARIADNEGNVPIDETIYPDGENAYFSNLPIKAMVKKIRENNIPANVSNTAGTFVCNHIMYGLLYLINKKYPDIKGGFIHVPFIPEQVMDKRNMPYMTLDEIVNGLTYAIEAVVENKEDIKLSCGKIC
ncbi:pyroglutamyl-peptidase I [Paramaledivibacter caminithermalis]|uniref:Pyrrolidone-carboxylate peptidase n=1 Tax=Paramaledivibacter caminithermalis (strain DSM 15212 / CIP 107654 / DViRD3) TaxID=1121301 RepID=A0A1M6LGR7_PARC5|nr:pyroglutamyl-peptidase I [Paramaledivibacter caminithermalis]SHJ70380.1 pyroglutamyl-peptidase [Paramaledivibacter caminithermalis DSM 15212]